MVNMAVQDPSLSPTNLTRVRSLGGVIAPQLSPLVSVPLEILLQINKHLTTPEYGNFRLTCKHIEDQLLNAFTREFFQKRQFMFTEFSLQTLLDISKSRFATSMKHVIFGLEQPSSVNPPQILRGPKPWARESVERQNKIMTDWINHETFLGTGQDVELLAQAFASLSKLETVGMRDFSSRSRFRDAPNQSWNSYGVSTYLQETGISIRVPYYKNSPGHHVIDTHRAFHNIIHAAAKASFRLQNFEIILRSWPLCDRAFHFPKYLEPKIEPIIANLQTLFMDLHSTESLMHVLINGTIQPCSSYFLMKFLARTINLEHLRLNLHDLNETSILSWLSRPSLDNSIHAVVEPEEPPPVTLQHLRRLDIGMVTIKPEPILAIIHKYRATLRVISLHKVSLIHEYDIPADERINLWAKLFNDLAALNLKLDAINMSYLVQKAQIQSDLKHYRAVTFKGSLIANVKHWAGNDTQSGLRDFEALVTIEGLDHDTDIESSNEDDDEDHSDDSVDDLDHEEEDEDEDDEDGDNE